VVARPGWQVAPLQQPVHDVVSQTQWPPLQRCPVAHASPDPQRHVPSAAQLSLVVAEQPVQMQRPALHELPGGHAGPLPQRAPSWLWL
jgi:hypothetical protein